MIKSENGATYVHEISKNSAQKVVLQLLSFAGDLYLDIRLYCKPDREKDEWFPTRKGLRFSVDLLPELLQGLNMMFEKDQNTQSEDGSDVEPL